MEQDQNEIENNQEQETDQKKLQKNSWMKRLKIDDFKFELILFLILGFLLGFTIKTEAAKKITIGFSDYKISKVKQGYDFTQMEKELKSSAAEQQVEQGNVDGQSE